MKKERFGFTEVAKQNGTLYFVVDAAEGMKVNFLTKEKNLHTGKPYIKRHPMHGQEGVNNVTQQKVVLHDISLGNYAVEITAGGKTETFEINNGDLTWR